MKNKDKILEIFTHLEEKLNNLNEDTDLDKLKEELKDLQQDLDDQE
jgi:vacuolar-type H+-ATPase subunit E/Vma4